MKRALLLIGLLSLALAVALFFRVRALRAASHGPAGGTGVIEGVDVNVTSRIATRITKVHVREGDVVKAGQVVAELDCTEGEALLAEAQSQLRASESTLAAAGSSAKAAGGTAAAATDTIGATTSQLEALEAQADLAKIDLERTRNLARAGTIGQALLDEAETRYHTLVHQIAAQKASEASARAQAAALTTAGSAAYSQVQAARNNVDVAHAAVARAEVMTHECVLVAPRDAMVATRALEPGEAVAPGSVLLSLTDVTEARTRFYLPNDDLAAAAPGRAVTLVADAYPGRTFRGTIFYVSPTAEFTPRNVQTREDRERLVYAVEVRVPNGVLTLRAGMPVEVTIDGTWR